MPSDPVPPTEKKRADEARGRPRRPVIGLEAEFTLVLDGKATRPETIFRDPRSFVRAPMMHRTGRSYSLPSGGAVYFDTGVIEVATPIIELEKGCCRRVTRSLWEQIEFVRGELDAWEESRGMELDLTGFSTHYNISAPANRTFTKRDALHAALLLSIILPAPMMLLAANRRSTGIGVRPRDHRFEITCDFTPDPNLMRVAAIFAFAVTNDVLSWPDHRLRQLRERGIPVISRFRPRRHTSRTGWLARHDCFPANPFAADPLAESWQLVDGRRRSLRQIALEIARIFRHPIGRMAGDQEAFDYLYAVLEGKARSLLDFDDRPPSYSDAGRAIPWDRRSRDLPRSAYENVIARILAGKPLRVGNKTYLPDRMRGWYEVVFRDSASGARRTFNLDELARRTLRTRRK